jgi:hypothetical protein
MIALSSIALKILAGLLFRVCRQPYTFHGLNGIDGDHADEDFSACLGPFLAAC